MASFSIIAAATYFPEYIRAKVSAGLMFNMMQEQPAIDSTNEAGKTPDIQGDVKFNNVCFSYPNSGAHLVLNCMNVEAKQGQTLALVGPSGCGKSTSIQLLERYYDVIAGSVVSFI
jgi:ABC-type multidrug transport system fused ATPase/permease subunit